VSKAEEVNMFSDDEEETPESIAKAKAAKEAAEKKKAEAMAGKKVKAPVIAKTIFIFDVKVFEME